MLNNLSESNRYWLRKLSDNWVQRKLSFWTMNCTRVVSNSRSIDIYRYLEMRPGIGPRLEFEENPFFLWKVQYQFQFRYVGPLTVTFQFKQARSKPTVTVRSCFIWIALVQTICIDHPSPVMIRPVMIRLKLIFTKFRIFRQFWSILSID